VLIIRMESSLVLIVPGGCAYNPYGE